MTQGYKNTLEAMMDPALKVHPDDDTPRCVLLNCGTQLVVVHMFFLVKCTQTWITGTGELHWRLCLCLNEHIKPLLLFINACMIISACAYNKPIKPFIVSTFYSHLYCKLHFRLRLCLNKGPVALRHGQQAALSASKDRSPSVLHHNY